ncbi:TetR/AcrR family transcriptional regulator [Streptomyces sp. NPDC090741]|uniref:TetR/AcrR family transcriptional regulator n=1 Tax=Streptomyces sp. NPDC090741 TaxID=3365967 RepID=UPI00380EFFF3
MAEQGKSPSSTQRAVPRTEQGRRTRAAIVKAAGELMYEHGVAATGLDQVLAASGAGKSQLYHYFGGKQDLTGAVIDLQLAGILQAQPRLTDLDSWADFDAWANELLALHQGPAGPLACPLGKLVGELDDDEVLRVRLADAYRAWESHLSEGLIRLRDNGALRPDADPQRLAAATMAALQGGMMMARLRHDITPLRDALGMALAHLRSHQA